MPWRSLGERELPVRTRRTGAVLYRIHLRDQPGRWFGPAVGEPPTYRFDDPKGEYRVCYLGASLDAAFAETFLRSPPRRLLSLRELGLRSATAFRLRRPVRLVTFHSKGLVRLGLTASDAHGAYDVCGRWARALWTHPDHPDGIEYRSRHDDGEFCIALFDRASDVLEQASVDALMADPHRVRTILRRYGVRLTR